MPVRKAKCPKCSKAFGILDRQLGTDVFCPHCGKKIHVPAADAAGASLQAAAAAQLFGGADEPARREPPTPKQRAETDAAEALQAVTSSSLPGGRPPPPPARGQRARPLPMADGAPSPGSDTALARHLGLDQHVEDESVLRRTPVRSKAALWIWGVLIVLALGGIVLAIFILPDRSEQSRMAADRSRATAGPASPKGHGPLPFTIGEGRSRPVMDDPEDELGHTDARVAAPDEIAPPPLTFHRIDDPVFNPYPKARLVQFAYVENYHDEMVRRAIVNMTATDPNREVHFADESFTFCDLKPGERAYFAFSYPFIPESGIGDEVLWGDETNEPVYEFEIGVRSMNPLGPQKGYVKCDVTNRSPVQAPVVDVLLILCDRRKRISGYAKGQLLNLRAGETREAKIYWENWESALCEQVRRSRAQIAVQDKPGP
jgi:hypothetical protein